MQYSRTWRRPGDRKAHFQSKGKTKIAVYFEKKVVNRGKNRKQERYNVTVSLVNVCWNRVRKNGGTVWYLADIEKHIPTKITVGGIEVEPKLIFKIEKRITRKKLFSSRMSAIARLLDSKSPQLT